MADEEATPEVGNKPGLFENKIVMIALMVVLQGGMAFAAMKFLIQPALEPAVAEGELAEGEGEAEARQLGVLVSLEEMIVSLNSPDRPRYLRTNISVEAKDQATADLGVRRIDVHEKNAWMLRSHLE